MNLNNIIAFVLIEIVGIGLLFQLISKKDKTQINNWLFIMVIALGFFILGKGISSLSTMGSINAILTFTSNQESFTPAFNRLHSTLDPLFWSGYTDMIIGSIMLASGLKKLHS